MIIALDDWEDADHYRLIAGQAYTNYAVEAKRSNDKGSLKLLEDLRRELDELEEFRIEDVSMMTKE
ncbi:hypothetical protein N0V95_000705 [Ascochyta clinopodiicola]|nr:hypothetical protein N0V95_000705 [Ascochyta clinopodiicola]